MDEDKCKGIVLPLTLAHSALVECFHLCWGESKWQARSTVFTPSLYSVLIIKQDVTLTCQEGSPGLNLSAPF